MWPKLLEQCKPSIELIWAAPHDSAPGACEVDSVMSCRKCKIPQEVESVQVMTDLHLLPREPRWHGLTLWTSSSDLEGSTRVRKCGHFVLYEVPGEDAPVICYKRSKHWMALYEGAMDVTSLVDSEKLRAASWHEEKVLFPVQHSAESRLTPGILIIFYF